MHTKTIKSEFEAGCFNFAAIASRLNIDPTQVGRIVKANPELNAIYNDYKANKEAKRAREAKQIIRLAAEGKSERQISKIVNLSSGLVHTILSDARVKVKPQAKEYVPFFPY